MAVRAKFKVNQVTTPRVVDRFNNKTQQNEQMAVIDIQMTPVTSGSAENEEFYAWTPGGSFNLTTVNLEAVKGLTLGTECYIDITPVE